MTAPLYRRLLGNRYASLPAAVQRLHDVTGPSVWRGEATVTRGSTLAARMLAALASLPKSTPEGKTCSVTVTFTPDGQGGERWVRTFATGPGPRRDFVSHQSETGGVLSERVLIARFAFALEAGGDGLRLALKRFYVLGIPLPGMLSPRVTTLECEREGRYQFDVEAELPLGLGLLVRYSGWLVEALP